MSFDKKEAPDYINNEQLEKKIDEQLENHDEAGYIEEGSSIFTAANIELKKAKKPEKAASRQIRVVIISVVVIAVLFGSYFSIQHFLPDKIASSSSSPFANTASSIAVMQEDVSKIDSINVTSADGNNYTLIPRIDNVVDASTSSTTQARNWYVKGLSNVVSQNIGITVQNVSAAATLTASREFTNVTDLAQYGLDKPTCTVVLNLSDKTTATLKIGKLSPDSSGYYVQTNKSSNVYIAGSGLLQIFDVNPASFINTAIFTPPTASGTDDVYFNNGSLVKYDQITISGTENPQTIVIKPLSNSKLGVADEIVEPTVNYANNNKIGDFVQMIGYGVTADIALCASPTATQLKNYGLDKPYSVITVKIKNENYTLKFGHPNSADMPKSLATDDTVMFNDYPVVFAVNPSQLTALSDHLQQLYYSVIYLSAIKDIKSITVASANENYAFDLSQSTSVDSSTSSTSYNTSVTYNGTALDVANFKNFYQEFENTNAVEWLTSDPELTAPPDVTVTITYVDSSKSSDVITLTPYTAQREVFKVNGVGRGLVTPDYVTNLLKCAKQAATNQTVVVTN